MRKYLRPRWSLIRSRRQLADAHKSLDDYVGPREHQAESTGEDQRAQRKVVYPTLLSVHPMLPEVVEWLVIAYHEVEDYPEATTNPI